MPYLTLENLDPYNFGYYDYGVHSRGKAFYDQGRVSVLSFDDSTAVCQVREDSATLRVLIQAESKRQIKAACECPQAKRAAFCKHMVAAVFGLREYLIAEAKNRWQYRLGLALENLPKKKTAAQSRLKSAFVFGLWREKYGDNSYRFSLYTFRIKSTEWPPLLDLARLESQAEKNQFLDQDRSWIGPAEGLATAIEPRTVVNLPFEGVYLYNMQLKSSLVSYGDPGTFLPLLARMNAPLFLMGSTRNVFKQRLQLLTDPGRLEAALARQDADLSLHAGLSLNGEIYSTTKNSLYIITTDPAWVMAGNQVLPVENPEVLNLLSYFPLRIPAAEEEEFRSRFWAPMIEHIPIQGDVVTYVDVDRDPIPRLYLKDEAGQMQASLRFGYGEYELDADPRAGPLTTREIPGSWSMLRIQRRLEQEEKFYQLLTDARYGLKRSGPPAPPGSFELRARTHPFDFLLHSIPLLAKAGFEVYGEDTLKAGRMNRATPTISLNITSGLDWFDIKAVVSYGDQQVPLQEIRRALKKKERYVKLADGSIGQIPEAWLERYKKLFDLAEENGEDLRLRDFHLPLVDTLLEDAGELQVAQEFQERRARLGGFERIEPQPLPAGFTGELRPYQKAGLDWLHFLHKYGFGGCLADDMGLGKTIQVLAFLQSLGEQGLRQGPALLVVPKSLITNWQREAERFTPELRILEFMGNVRKKDPAYFNQYDIILTTYGTMLRDIEFLHGIHFQYAILDESQAIKNPLAQSSKATRLLNASHRLVMTGTPVENNTFELWAQFAFLNPGLLGSMDYFKREFANPIENRESEAGPQAAEMLRRLVYPFILRRTKEQVAKELPERTERVLYTDMEPAQRKLYNHTRDYYRGLLMGLLNDEGINDVRMKILEGLLRLRQICIHPRLVDPNFHGDSAKFELLLETLETLRGEGHKVLVFSQFVQTLSLLRAELDARQVRYTYLDGQTSDRQGQVDTFQNDPSIPFFLISLKAGGVGLNLTAADYVIHIDPWWNPAVEMQAADRAHRIGQDKPVFIYKMIARDSVEEKILKLQEHKKELVDQIIAAEGSFFKSITPDDVKVLFS